MSGSENAKPFPALFWCKFESCRHLQNRSARMSDGHSSRSVNEHPETRRTERSGEKPCFLFSIEQLSFRAEFETKAIARFASNPTGFFPVWHRKCFSRTTDG
jgi:hypothetical protein